MKTYKDSESFDESRSISDVFNFPESENQKQILNKDFVFEYEDNSQQTGIDLNDTSLGDEDNHKTNSDEEFKRIKEAAQNEGEASETSSSASSSSSSASSTASSSSTTAASGASSTVATVAATTTAAVVVVVGGGIAVYGQTVDKPSICQFDTVEVVENRIDFTISIGNNQKRIDEGLEDTECDIKIELKCPSMEDFEQIVQVNRFGKYTDSFKELEYDTEYLLNVSQHVMLSADSEYLLDKPISVRTAAKEVEPTPEVAPITIYKELDPLGGAYYYVEVASNINIPTYDEYYIGMYPITNNILRADGDTGTSNPGDTSTEDPGGEPDDPGSDPDESQTEWYVVSNYDASIRGKQRLNTSDALDAANYYVALIGCSAESKEEREIVSLKIASSSFVTSDVDLSSPKVFFNRICETTTGAYTYNVYVNMPSDPGYEKYMGLISDTQSADSRMYFDVDGLNKKIQPELLFDEYQMSHYGVYEVEIFAVATDSQQDVTLIKETIDFNYIPTLYTTDPNPNSITIYCETDPMNGSYYYADVQYINELPSYNNYAVYMRYSGSSEWEVMSKYDATYFGKQPLYVSGTLDKASYEVAFVGYDEPANAEVIYTEDVRSSEFITSTCDTSVSRTFFKREYYTSFSELATYVYVNIPGDISRLSGFSGTITDPDNQQNMIRFSVDSLNAKQQIILNFDEAGMSDYGVYDVKVIAYDPTGQEITLTNEAIDFGLMPYESISPTGGYAFEIFEEVDPVGGYHYYIDVTYDDYIPKEDITGYYIGMRDAESQEEEWQILSEYDVTTMGKQPISSALEELTAEEYVVEFFALTNDETQKQLFTDLLYSDEFTPQNPSVDDAVYFLREIDADTGYYTYYAYLNYTGSNAETLTEINGVLAEDGSTAAYVTFDPDKVNSIVECAFTWGNANEFGTYDIIIYARDSSSGQSQGQITIYESFTVDFSEIPTRTVSNPRISGATFGNAMSASGQNGYAIVNLDMFNPNNYWTNFEITITYENDPYTQSYNLVQYPYQPTTTNRYYLDGMGMNDITQNLFKFSISAVVNGGSTQTIYESPDDQYVYSFYDNTYSIDGSISAYADLDSSMEKQVIYFRVTFDQDSTYYQDFDYIEVEFVNSEDATDTYTYTVDPNNLSDPIETELVNDDITGITYKVRTIGYVGTDETVIFYEEFMLAQA